MSSQTDKSLNRKEMVGMLATIGSKFSEDDSQTETTEYNWYQPHCFSLEQLKRLNDFSKKFAAIASLRLNPLFQSNLTITIEATTQHFSSDLFAKESETENYYLAFNNEHEIQYGFLCIPSKTAFAWTTQLLGEPESEQDISKSLSLLEESLLMDVLSVIVESVSSSHDTYDLKPAEIIIKGQAPFYMEGTEELCKISLGIQKEGSDKSEFSVFLLCNLLEPVVGKSDQVVEKFSDADILKAIIERLNKMSVSVTAQLSSTVLTFEEIMGLQPGDILLLDKKVDEPIDIIVEGEIIFHGQPAKSAGKYAVVIKEVCNNNL